MPAGINPTGIVQGYASFFFMVNTTRKMTILPEFIGIHDRLPARIIAGDGWSGWSPVPPPDVP
jgi:hypothetical protein